MPFFSKYKIKFISFIKSIYLKIQRILFKLKNFKSIKHIALAKAEIIKNTRSNGFVVLNADDNFFKLHQKMTIKNNLKMISFGIKNYNSDIKLLKIKRKG